MQGFVGIRINHGMKCIFRLPLILCVAGLAFPVLSSAVESSKDQAHEYAEARKIALKDVHVQEAYQRADEKLDDRILEIDPSLKSYMDKRKGQKPEASAPVKAKTTAAPVKHTVAEPKSGRGGYVVAKGDTLSSIAVHYDVSVASLKSANGIADERKLRVGQKLVIPAKSAVKPTTSTTKARAAAPAAKPEPSFWDKIKSDI